MSTLYAVYDFTADVWYCVGAYDHSWQVSEYYKALIEAPFWKRRPSALYAVGEFNLDTGEVTSCPRVRIMEACLENLFFDDYTHTPEANSEGAGGEEPPVESAKKVDSRDLHPDLEFSEDAQS